MELSWGKTNTSELQGKLILKELQILTFNQHVDLCALEKAGGKNVQRVTSRTHITNSSNVSKFSKSGEVIIVIYFYDEYFWALM